MEIVTVSSAFCDNLLAGIKSLKEEPGWPVLSLVEWENWCSRTVAENID